MPQAQSFDSFKTLQSCPRSLSFFTLGRYFFFPTGLCLFPGPTTPGCIKVRFQNFPNFGEFIDLFTVPRDGGRKASQRPGGSQDCQRTVWATWLPKFTAGGLMRNYVEETAAEASGWPGFFRMRKRARKKKSNFVPSLTEVWKQRCLPLSNETTPFIGTRFLKVHWVAPYEKTLIVNSYYKNVSSLIKLSEMRFLWIHLPPGDLRNCCILCIFWTWLLRNLDNMFSLHKSGKTYFVLFSRLWTFTVISLSAQMVPQPSSNPKGNCKCCYNKTRLAHWQLWCLCWTRVQRSC